LFVTKKLFILFYLTLAKRRHPKGICADKATQIKEIHHTAFLRPPQVRCAQVIGGRSTPTKKLFLFILFDSRDSAIHPKGICGLGKTKEMSL
jgi:hypothetical protein